MTRRTAHYAIKDTRDGRYIRYNTQAAQPIGPTVTLADCTIFVDYKGGRVAEAVERLNSIYGIDSLVAVGLVKQGGGTWKELV